MLHILTAAGILVCAVQAIRVPRLLYSAMWLAGTSALIALLMYMLGAPEAAVIELSVGAGLVTVIFVFAINIAGDETFKGRALIPKPLSILLIAIAVLLIGWFTLPALNTPLAESVNVPFVAQTLWEDRNLDILLQSVMIFTGTLGILGLLSEPREKKNGQ
jgi:NADH:ubiquinone oxidoreductase subunit 6 (subunit J)